MLTISLLKAQSTMKHRQIVNLTFE